MGIVLAVLSVLVAGPVALQWMAKAICVVGTEAPIVIC